MTYLPTTFKERLKYYPLVILVAVFWLLLNIKDLFTRSSKRKEV